MVQKGETRRDQLLDVIEDASLSIPRSADGQSAGPAVMPAFFMSGIRKRTLRFATGYFAGVASSPTPDFGNSASRSATVAARFAAVDPLPPAAAPGPAGGGER